MSLTLLAICVGAAYAQDQEFGAESDTPRGGENSPDLQGDDRPDDQGRRGRGDRRPPNPMFEAIDVDGDLVITKQELRKAIAALQQLDADGDGNITLAEASPQRRGFDRGRPGGPGGGPDAFVDRFMENDANGDGKLTPDEVPERAMPMLRGGDANGDGAIDRAELAQIAENLGGRFGRGEPGQRGGPGGPGGPGGDTQGFVERLMQNDRNGDGKLTPDEVPEQMGRMLRGGDANGDGAIDARELIQVVDNFRQRARGGDRRERGQPGDRGQRGGRPDFERPDAER